MPRLLKFTYLDDKTVDLTVSDENVELFMRAFHAGESYVDPTSKKGVWIDKQKVRYLESIEVQDKPPEGQGEEEAKTEAKVE